MEFERAEVLSRRDAVIQFTSENDRLFAGGGWLESHVWRAVNAVKRDIGIRETAMNLVVESDQGVKNELDVAFLARNLLFVIECKSARMNGRDEDVKAKATDALYKLSEISKRVGGLGARTMLVSYRDVGQADRKRARDLRIEVVAFREILRLKEKLQVWVGQRQ